MDEKPYQLLGETREPLPMRPGDDQKTDSEYVRNGTCSLFVFTEPLGEFDMSVSETNEPQRTGQKKSNIFVTSCTQMQKIVLMMDNLNTHKPASLYKKYPAPEARRIIKRLEIHYTPKYGSWLDKAKIELNVMTRHCLSRRIVDLEILRTELTHWEADRNSAFSKIQWHFQAKDAREKLISLYPIIITVDS